MLVCDGGRVKMYTHIFGFGTPIKLILADKVWVSVRIMLRVANLGNEIRDTEIESRGVGNGEEVSPSPAD